MSSSTAAGARQHPAGADPALRFVITAGVWLVGMFALLRSAWIRQGLLDPFAHLQQRVTAELLGAPTTGVVIDASCSGGDAMVLCLGVLLAYPATWRERLRGISIGFALILGLNLLRIATLSAVVGNPPLFDLLHLYVWRAVLIVAVGTYAFAWMHSVGRRRDAAAAPGRARVLRFAVLASLCAGAYFAASPWLLGGGVTQAATRQVAAWGAGILGALGISATAAGSILSTPRGSFLVTPECVVTPLIPLYVAVLFTVPLSAARRAVGLLFAPPAFFLLGVARLLVLALPAFLVPSYTLAIHAFSQFLVALLIIVATVFMLREGPLRERARRAGLAIFGFVAAGVIAGPVWTRAINVVTSGLQGLLLDGAHAYPDPQGAMAMLPAFQLALAVGLYVACGTSGARLRPATAAAVLAGVQIVVVTLLAESYAHLGLSLHVALVRAFAVLVPVALVLPLERGVRAARAPAEVTDAVKQPG
ncbi:MAG: hypothetical protein PVJ49_08630 [Acidobacteriota bacterium]